MSATYILYVRRVAMCTQWFLSKDRLNMSSWKEGRFITLPILSLSPQIWNWFDGFYIFVWFGIFMCIFLTHVHPVSKVCPCVYWLVNSQFMLWIGSKSWRDNPLFQGSLSLCSSTLDMCNLSLTRLAWEWENMIVTLCVRHWTFFVHSISLSNPLIDWLTVDSHFC